MILSIRRYLTTSYISFAIIDNKFYVYVNIYKNNKLIRQSFKNFTAKEKAIRYIEDVVKNTYFYYLGMFFTSVGQGALPDIEAKTLEKFHINKNNVSLVNLKSFYLYANNQELNKCITTFEDVEIDVDFVFSPFAILFFQIRHLDLFNSQKNVFYILRHENYITFLIVKNKKLLFSSFFYISGAEVSISGLDSTDNDYIRSEIEDIVEQKEEDEEDLFKESDIVFDDIESIEDMDNLENLSLDSIDDGEEEENLETFSGDMDLFDYVKSALNDYYSNELYESDFIEEMVIFTNDKISKSVIKMIEDELLMQPHIFDVDIYEQMNNMMRDSL